LSDLPTDADLNATLQRAGFTHCCGKPYPWAGLLPKVLVGDGLIPRPVAIPRAPDAPRLIVRGTITTHALAKTMWPKRKKVKS